MNVLNGNETRVFNELGCGSEFNPSNLAVFGDPQVIVPPLVGHVSLEFTKISPVDATTGVLLPAAAGGGGSRSYGAGTWTLVERWARSIYHGTVLVAASGPCGCRLCLS